MVFNAKEFTKQGINVPILIGGATTSKMHTAVKIEPNYKSNLAMHVLDASRAVVVVNSLMSKESSNDYMLDIRDEYDEQRKEYYEGQKDKVFISLENARKKKLVTDWAHLKIKEPSFIGTKVFKAYSLKSVVDYIDWDPFFQSW